MSDNTDLSVLVATKVGDDQRMDFLPKYFGIKLMMRAESHVFSLMRAMSKEYTGGMWDFFEVNNGTFFMAPQFEGKQEFVAPGHHPCKGMMDAVAVGVTITLYAMNALMSGSGSDEEDLLIQRYHWLRDYALTLPDVRTILQFID